MKIDISSHIQGPKYTAALEKKVLPGIFKQLNHNFFTTLIDFDKRFRIADKYPDRVEILSVTMQPPELLAPDAAVEICQIANDEMAELIAKYPDRFVTAMACLPWNDIDAALRELDRAINDLHFKSVVIWTSLGGKPIDMPALMPFYEKMTQYDLPVFIHPMFPLPSLTTLEEFNACRIFTGPQGDKAFALHRTIEITMGTTMATTRLVCSQILDKFPNLKLIVHHGGAGISFLSQRLVLTHDVRQDVEGVSYGLTQPILDYYKKFYVDTALHGNVPAMMCSHSFFGTDHMLFGTDFPFDAELGNWSIATNIEQIEQAPLSEEDKVKIFEGNARELFHLAI